MGHREVGFTFKNGHHQTGPVGPFVPIGDIARLLEMKEVANDSVCSQWAVATVGRWN